jgi:hypothetical protein
MECCAVVMPQQTTTVTTTSSTNDEANPSKSDIQNKQLTNQLFKKEKVKIARNNR